MNAEVRDRINIMAEQPIDENDRDLTILQRVWRINTDKAEITPLMVIEITFSSSDSPLRPGRVRVGLAPYHPEGLFRPSETYVSIGENCYRTWQGARAALLYNARCRVDQVEGMQEPG
jgi:hypothetical protein